MVVFVVLVILSLVAVLFASDVSNGVVVVELGSAAQVKTEIFKTNKIQKKDVIFDFILKVLLMLESFQQKCVKRTQNIYNNQTRQCPEENYQFKNTKTCACDECKPFSEPNCECPTDHCFGDVDCCCVAGFLTYIENGKRHCTKECPENYCQVQDVCVPVGDLKCPAGFFKEYDPNTKQCCKECTDKCCAQCDQNGKCDSCANKNQLYAPWSYTILQGTPCQKKVSLKPRDVLSTDCSCCKQYGEECHCSFCDKNTCHENHPECPICPDKTYEVNVKDTAGNLVSENLCVDCHPDCETCFGPNQNQCIHCNPEGSKRYLHKTTCVDSCPKGYFESNNTGNCSCCHGFKTCQCPYNGQYPIGHDDPFIFALHNKQTGQIVNDKVYFHYCEKCHEHCDECYGPGSNQCSKCKWGYTMSVNGDVCVPDENCNQKSLTCGTPSTFFKTSPQSQTLSDDAGYDSIIGAPSTSGYCTKSDISFGNLGNQATCGGTNSNIGYYINFKFWVSTHQQKWSFKFGMDFGRGGVSKLDGVVQKGTRQDMWWSGDFNNAPQLNFDATLSTGEHVVELIGAEGCCDGNAKIQFQVDNGAWEDVSVENLKQHCQDTPPCPSHSQISNVQPSTPTPQQEVQSQDLHYVFIIDESGSMGGPTQSNSYWQILITAIDDFLTARKTLNRNDQISVISYSSTARIQYNKVDLKSFSASSITYRGGGTNFGAGLDEFISLFPTPGTEKHRIVMSFMSDGQASTPTSQLNTIKNDAPLMALILRCWVSAIGNNVSTNALQTIATDLHGQFKEYTTEQEFYTFYHNQALQ